MYQIRTKVALAVRNPKEAKSITGILQIAQAGEEISDAAGDLANLVLRELEIHQTVKEALKGANEKIAKIKTQKDSQLTNQKLKNLQLASKFSIWILAIKRDGKWLLSPEAEDEIKPEDTILIRGPEDGITKFSYMTKTETPEWDVSDKNEKLRNLLSQMRDTGCSLVDMAFSSVLFNSKNVAEEVRELEQKFDQYNYEAWQEVLKAAKEEEDITQLNSALQFVKSLETISDASDSIADVVLRGTDLHPVFTQALEDAEEKIDRLEIEQDSSLANKTLEELDLWKSSGVYVISVKKHDRHVLCPSKDTRLSVGNKIIVRGSRKGVQEIEKVAKGEKKWKHLEE